MLSFQRPDRRDGEFEVEVVLSEETQHREGDELGPASGVKDWTLVVGAEEETGALKQLWKILV